MTTNNYYCHSTERINPLCVHLSRQTDPLCEGCVTIQDTEPMRYLEETPQQRTQRLWHERWNNRRARS